MYNLSRLRVLVVDDNFHMRKLVGTVLGAFGVRDIYQAEAAEDAWRVLKAHQIDILILDWVMPGLSGLDLTRRIRTAPDSASPYLPIIMLTGHTQIERVQQARDAGVTEFLAKPLTAKALLSRILAVVEHPRAFVRTQAYFGPCRRRRRNDAYQGSERRVATEQVQV